MTGPRAGLMSQASWRLEQVFGWPGIPERHRAEHSVVDFPGDRAVTLDAERSTSYQHVRWTCCATAARSAYSPPGGWSAETAAHIVGNPVLVVGQTMQEVWRLRRAELVQTSSTWPVRRPDRPELRRLIAAARPVSIPIVLYQEVQPRQRDRLSTGGSISAPLGEHCVDGRPGRPAPALLPTSTDPSPRVPHVVDAVPVSSEIRFPEIVYRRAYGPRRHSHRRAHLTPACHGTSADAHQRDFLSSQVVTDPWRRFDRPIGTTRRSTPWSTCGAGAIKTQPATDRITAFFRQQSVV